MSNTIQKCTAVEARVALDRGGGCQLVDVREFSEYDAERVRGSTLAPLSALDQNLGLIDRDRPVYLMCRSGKRAAQAAERLAGQGFKDLRIIDGGLQGWSEAGLPVEWGTGRVWSLERPGPVRRLSLRADGYSSKSHLPVVRPALQIYRRGADVLGNNRHVRHGDDAGAAALESEAEDSVRCGFVGHLGERQVHLPLTAAFTVMALAGTFVGEHFAKRVPAQHLRRVFAYFVIVVAIFLVAENSRALI